MKLQLTAVMSILFLVLTPQFVLGTCIIVVKTCTQVFLAADSKQTDNTGTISRSVCKIVEGKGFYWAAAGPIYSDPYTGFEVEKLVGSVEASGTLVTKMDTLIKNTREPMAKELASIKTDDPRTYAKIVTGQTPLLEVVFVAIESGRPSVVFVNFTVREEDGTIRIEGRPVPAPEPTSERPSVFLPLGESKEAEAYISTHGRALVVDTVSTIRESFAIEEAAKKEFVGGKISILQIDATGPTWIDKGECK